MSRVINMLLLFYSSQLPMLKDKGLGVENQVCYMALNQGHNFSLGT
jgi:hypothetical protein